MGFEHIHAWPVAVVCSARVHTHTQHTHTVSQQQTHTPPHVLQQVKEILVEESNVQPVNAPVTVSCVRVCDVVLLLRPSSPAIPGTESVLLH